MQYQKIIRAFTAGLLLLAFLLGITPRLYLHDLFANHSELVTTSDHSESGQVSASGFSCAINDQVATSPFTDNNTTVEFVTLAVYPAFHSPFSEQVTSATHLFSALRGPPQLA